MFAHIHPRDNICLESPLSALRKPQFRQHRYDPLAHSDTSRVSGIGLCLDELHGSTSNRCRHPSSYQSFSFSAFCRASCHAGRRSEIIGKTSLMSGAVIPSSFTASGAFSGCEKFRLMLELDPPPFGEGKNPTAW